MYNLKSNKKSIQEYKIIFNNLFYKIKGNDYFLYLNDVLIDEKNHGFFSFDKYYGLHHQNSTDLIYMFSKDKITLPVTFITNTFYDNNFIISKNSIREGTGLYSSNYVICQLFPFKELYELPHRYYGSGYRIANQYVQIQNERKLIRSLSLLTGEYEWEVDLGVQGLEVGGILGVEGANLIVLCENKQHQQVLLSLDVATGREVWRRDLQVSYGGTYAFNEDKTSIFYMHAGGLWLNGVRVAQGSNIFREIDTADGSVRREGVLWQMDGAGLGIKNCTFQDGFIYFTAVYQSFGPTVIGVLDYETLSLLWWEEVQMQEADGFGNFFLNQPLQVSENKIYVLDKTHVLHIYERDGSVPFAKPTGSGLAGFENLPMPEDLPWGNTNNQNNGELPF